MAIAPKASSMNVFDEYGAIRPSQMNVSPNQQSGNLRTPNVKQNKSSHKVENNDDLGTFLTDMKSVAGLGKMQSPKVKKSSMGINLFNPNKSVD